MIHRKSWNFVVLVAALALLAPALVWAAYPAEVPRTGQTTCYNASGTVIDCDGTGQDGAIQAGAVWPDPRFTDRADGTVSDNLTGLVWAKNANLLGTDDADNDTDGTAGDGMVTWQHALDYIKRLNRESYLGYNDWRLPNVNELESLLNAQLCNPPLPQGHPFANVQLYYYWSSTSGASYMGDAWVVDMIVGSVDCGGKTYNTYVWPVRSEQCGSLDNSVICLPKTGQTKCYNEAGDNMTCDDTGQDGAILAGAVWPDPRFSVIGDAVTDTLTGLVWAKNTNLMVTRDPAFDTDYDFESPNDGMVTWQHALDYVAKLNSESYLNHTDWRLPNRRELRSLVDYSKYNPALPQGHPFANVPSDSFYWSSTSSAYDTFSALVMRMNDGYVGIGWGGSNKAFKVYVWPVCSGQVGNPLITSTSTTIAGPTTTSIISSTTTTGGGSTTTTTPGGSTTTTTVSSGGTTTTSIGAATTTIPVTTTVLATTTTAPVATTTTTTTGCPAKKALGENNPKLENLRDFRDSKLAQSAVGRRIINIYYNNAGSINAALERSPALRAVTRRVLEVIAPMVGKN
jgi:hypothetical protein